MMYFTDIREHAIPLFIDADILPVSLMYYKTVASLMRDINSNNSSTNFFNSFITYTIIYFKAGNTQKLLVSFRGKTLE